MVWLGADWCLGPDVVSKLGLQDCHNPTVVYTGADDAKLKAWDTRANLADAPLQTNSKSHEAGVCSLQVNRHREHCLYK